MTIWEPAMGGLGRGASTFDLKKGGRPILRSRLLQGETMAGG